jgi:hypothetical protein
MRENSRKPELQDDFGSSADGYDHNIRCAGRHEQKRRRAEEPSSWDVRADTSGALRFVRQMF